MPKKAERQMTKPIWEIYKHPPTVEEVPDYFRRWEWWTYVSVKHFPKHPPTANEEPGSLCREKWWKRVPLKYLPKRYSAVRIEQDPDCRGFWWKRIPVKYLPKRPPTSDEEPDWLCRIQWWKRVPIKYLPKRQPTIKKETACGCRWWWWRRIPKKYLPKYPPTINEEWDDNCHHEWWRRMYGECQFQTLRQWFNVYGVKVRGNKVTLYKRVAADYSTQNEIKYVPGTIVEAPDWDDNPERECGGGLHVCPAPRYCDQFRSGDNFDLYVELEYDLNDPVVVVENPKHPEKIRVKKVKVLRAWSVKNRSKDSEDSYGD